MIETILKTVEDSLVELPELRYVSEDWGQLEYYDNPPAKFPLALIELEKSDFSQSNYGSERGKAIISITVGDIYPKQSSTNSTRNPYDVFKLISTINKQIQSINGKNHSPLIRQSVSRIRRDDEIRTFRITYVCNFSE